MFSLVPILKQQFNELINGKGQTNRDQKLNLSFLQRHNQSRKFRIKLVKNWQKHYKDIDIYYIGYIAIKILVILKIFTVQILCIFLLIKQVDILKEKEGNKYLIFNDFVYENKELLKKYADVWDGIKNEIRLTNDGNENDYGQECMKIKCISDDDLPLKKPIKFHAMTIIIRSVFEEGGKRYPQVFF